MAQQAGHLRDHVFVCTCYSDVSVHVLYKEKIKHTHQMQSLIQKIIEIPATNHHCVLSDAAKVKLVVLLCCRESVSNHHGNSHRSHPSRDRGQ